ncbi:hypothetical protein [Salsipaludibacter albus]|uniref:hypothetical protein n=1 Tax=Salsipaludibacter albus TaxID=2849650 RepID=UPI001EE3C15C|nr:hypothetical protein [Salsipaludibacter albus]MBY5163016.1 hypothetical protein [Salsipaludibacter albus]
MVDPTVTSYRSLRIGMVGAVVALAVSIGFERLGVDCWQPSISGYYYTPVRAILVGALMAVGLSLVVVKGRTQVEDALLNVAGMLAPVVAVVPTTQVSACWSVPPARFPVDVDTFDRLFAATIDNNMVALLVTGALGLVVAAVLASASPGGPRSAMARLEPATRWGVQGAAVLLAAAAAALAWWPAFPLWAHDLAAITMFGCLVVAVWINGRESGATGQSAYRAAYRAIAIAMVAPALLFLPAFAGFAHRVFVVEAIEIVLFAVFWIVQTRQFWTPSPRTDRPPA